MELRCRTVKADDDDAKKGNPKPKDAKPIPKAKSKSPFKSPTKPKSKITKPTPRSKSPLKKTLPAGAALGKTMAPPNKNFLLNFWYLSSPGITTDHKGRSAVDYFKLDMNELEKLHDYIQTAFPLPEPSKFAPGPLIDRELFDLVRSKDVEGVSMMRSNIMRFFMRMCMFYGMKVILGEEGRISRIVPGHDAPEGYPDPEKQRANWVMKNNHNHRRISRIIRSLRILDFEEVAQMFFGAVMKVNEMYPGVIGKTSVFMWENAARRDVWLTPEDKDDAKGCEWLREAMEELNGKGKGKAKKK